MTKTISLHFFIAVLLFNLCHMLTETMDVICQIMESSIHSLILKSSRLPPAFEWVFKHSTPDAEGFAKCKTMFKKGTKRSSRAINQCWVVFHVSFVGFPVSLTNKLFISWPNRLETSHANELRSPKRIRSQENLKCIKCWTRVLVE